MDGWDGMGWDGMGWDGGTGWRDGMTGRDRLYNPIDSGRYVPTVHKRQGFFCDFCILLATSRLISGPSQT